MRLKFFLVGGRVASKDGQVHFIVPHRLMELYGLREKDCIFDSRSVDNYIMLGPRVEGDYKEYVRMVIDAYIRDLKCQPDCCLVCRRYERCQYRRDEGVCIIYDRINEEALRNEYV